MGNITRTDIIRKHYGLLEKDRTPRKLELKRLVKDDILVHLLAQIFSLGKHEISEPDPSAMTNAIFSLKKQIIIIYLNWIKCSFC